jgi:cytoskeletal protein CcmA (bactofilin family)
MALWKEPTSSSPSERSVAPAPSALGNGAAQPEAAAVARPAAAAASSGAAARESVIAPDLSIEGKIEGNGNVRIAGRFKGDIHVQGSLTIEASASVTGQVQARSIVVAGELNGNVLGAERVELVDSGAVNGDVKAGSLTVAAGARMRGQVEFGWKEKG